MSTHETMNFYESSFFGSAMKFIKGLLRYFKGFVDFKKFS